MAKVEARKIDPPFKISLDKDPGAQNEISSENPGDVPVAISLDKFDIPKKSTFEDVRQFINKMRPGLLDKVEKEGKRAVFLKKGVKWVLIIGSVAAIGAIAIHQLKKGKDDETILEDE